MPTFDWPNELATSLQAQGVPSYKVAPSLADANATLQVADGEIHRMSAGVQTATRTLTLGVTGAAIGRMKRIENYGDTHNINITNGGPMGDSLTAVVPGMARDYIFDGVEWQEGGAYPLR